MTLIEGGEGTLGAEVEPVLRDAMWPMRLARWWPSSGRGLSGVLALACRGRRSLAAGDDMTLASEVRVIVNRLRIGVEQRCGETAAQSAAQLQLPRLTRGVSTRGLIDETRRTVRARIGCANRIGVGQKLLYAARPFDAEIGCSQLQRRRQIALHG